MQAPRKVAFLAWALLACTACGGPTTDIAKALEVTDVTTGWYDAGVENGQNKLVPTVGLRLRNVTGASVSNVQLNAVFRRVGETEEWGTSYARVISRDGLAPEASTDPVVLRSNLGYTSIEPRAVMLSHSKFKDVQVRVFAKHGGAQWVPLGDWDVERTMLAKEPVKRVASSQ